MTSFITTSALVILHEDKMDLMLKKSLLESNHGSGTLSQAVRKPWVRRPDIKRD